MIPAAAPAQPVPAMASALPNAIGSGTDSPPVLAPREIVPPHYAYSFDSSVDQCVRVSWSGGKPWNLTLSDALRPLGLSAEISGMTVKILRSEQVGANPSEAVPLMGSARALGPVPA